LRQARRAASRQARRAALRRAALVMVMVLKGGLVFAVVGHLTLFRLHFYHVAFYEKMCNLDQIAGFQGIGRLIHSRKSPRRRRQNRKACHIRR
jgi:hypothetical protein